MACSAKRSTSAREKGAAAMAEPMVVLNQPLPNWAGSSVLSEMGTPAASNVRCISRRQPGLDVCPS